MIMLHKIFSLVLLFAGFNIIAHGAVLNQDSNEELPSNLELAATKNICATGRADGEAVFSIGQDPGNWLDAQLKCKSQGKTLASVQGVIDYGKIVSLIVDHGLLTSEFWLSGNNLSGDWTWGNTGNSIVFKKWGRGEPNNAGANSYCMTLQKDLVFNDDDCLNKLYYICESSLQ